MVDVEMTHEHEITRPVQECLVDGSLNPDAVGWSRHPLHDCNLLGRPGRKKKWEYWGVTTDTHMFSLTFADIDYFGLISAGFMADYSGTPMCEQVGIVPFGIGMEMAPTVASGAMSARTPGLSVTVNRERGGAVTVLQASGRLGGHRLQADLRIETPPGHETLNVLVPWSQRRFQFTSKQNCLPTTGTVVFDGTEYGFGPDNHAFGCLDFGRGIWPYRTKWNWASGSGLAGNSTVGITVGGKWTDGTGVTENGFVVDGVLHKLGEELEWDYDPEAPQEPWTIRAAKTGRLELTLEPFSVRANRLNLGVLSTKIAQAFGRFHGTLVCDDGKVVEVSDIVGWAEEHTARW